MYTQIWNKYLPIIKILMKRSVNEDQVLSLNVTDFERAGAARKSGYKFLIIFSNGRVDNILSASPLAKDLAAMLLQESATRELIMQNDYQINMTAKFQLGIKHMGKIASEEEAVAVEAGNEDEENDQQNENDN